MVSNQKLEGVVGQSATISWKVLFVSSNNSEGMVGQSAIIDWKVLLLATITWKALAVSQPKQF